MVENHAQLPLVSFLIVARNAEQFLPGILDDYLHQDYPAPRRELIIVDGISEDRTKAIAQEFARQHPDLMITILDNHQLMLASGWNLGIKAARGEILCRFDAHASLPPYYISYGVNLLRRFQNEGVVCVGGTLETKGAGFWGQAIARVVSSPFGVGNSKFRYSQTPGVVDTVAYGLYWKWVFDAVGLFREDLDRNQDIELHFRIRNLGWKFYLSPELITTYFCRSQVPGFLRQAFWNGYWVMVTWRESRWRHLVPFLFVGGLAALGLGSLVFSASGTIFLLLTGAYVLLSLYFSGKFAIKHSDWTCILAMPFLFFLLHVTYGLGSWWALISRLIGGRDRNSRRLDQ